MKKRKLLRDSLIYTLLPKISTLASLIVTPLISKYLTLSDFGIFGLLMSFMAVFQILIIVGQNVVMQNAYFENYRTFAYVWRRSFGMMILTGLVCAILFSLVIILLMKTQLGKNLPAVIALVSLCIVLSPVDTVAVNYFILKQRPFPYAMATALVGIVNVLVSFFGIRYFNLGYMAWVIGMPVGSIILIISLSRILFIKEKLYPIFKIKLNFVKQALKVGAPMIPHQLSLYVLGTSDRIVLESNNVSTRDLGIYSQGYNLGSYANLLINGVFQAFALNIQENFRQEEPVHKQRIRKMITYIPILISCLIAFGCLWMKEIYHFLYRKEELQIGYPIAIIVMCSYMYWPIYTFFTYPLSIKKKTGSIAKISAFAAIINLTANIILIPKFGIWASVWITYVAYMIFGFAGLIDTDNRNYLNKYVNIVKTCVLTFSFNILVFILVFFVRDFNILFKTIASVLFLLLIPLIYIYYLRNIKNEAQSV